mmetsp:Transcript_60216/g.176737  ORF Transcript_60216/g.176737 Transcript_60216/m.176737 type:complete len:240 (+) Transcript_60216:1108-1827(+)
MLGLGGQHGHKPALLRSVRELLDRLLVAVHLHGARAGHDAPAPFLRGVRGHDALAPVPDRDLRALHGVGDGDVPPIRLRVVLLPARIHVEVEHLDDGRHAPGPVFGRFALQAVEPAVVEGEPVLVALLLVALGVVGRGARVAVRTRTGPLGAPAQDLDVRERGLQDQVVLLAGRSLHLDQVHGRVDRALVPERRPDVVLGEVEGEGRDEFLLVDGHGLFARCASCALCRELVGSPETNS